MKTKSLIISILCAMLAFPASAVINSQDLAGTISALKTELERDYSSINDSKAEFRKKIDTQHREMRELTQQCNEIALILYSQHKNFIFDISYALRQVTEQYETFENNRMPYQEILSSIDLELDRYQKMLVSLNEMPEDEVSKEDRDSCIYYASAMQTIFLEMKNSFAADSAYYQKAGKDIVDLYNYSQERYKEIQREIFVNGQDGYLSIVRSLGTYFKSAINDLSSKIKSGKETNNDSLWSVAIGMIFTYLWLLATIFISMRISLKGKHVKSNLKNYLPILVLSLVVILFRILFLPNKIINLLLPPLLIAFFFWQLMVNSKTGKEISRSVTSLAWASMMIIAGVAVISLLGYIFLSIQIIIWWMFQLTFLETIMAIKELLNLYKSKKLDSRLEAHKNDAVELTFPKLKGNFIRYTWFFDLLNTAIVPILVVISIPMSFMMASGIFDISEIVKNFIIEPFLNIADKEGNIILDLSFSKILVIACFFFIFKYLAYALKSLYRVARLEKVKRENNLDIVHANQVNLTLANNLIIFISWGLYAALLIVLFKIPLGALSIVAAGLATGLGLAMKDILNNFIYGIQLMSGRLRVGDFIECDGIRGEVESISYQSTQIITSEGAVIAFTNTTLFNKNFKNITKLSSYEFCKFIVGVSYGSDISKVRSLIIDAMNTLQGVDSFGRDIFEKKYGIVVSFDDFADSSVNLAIKFNVLVDQRVSFISNAKETIYNTLNANNIEIPFPQRDLHIRND